MDKYRIGIIGAGNWGMAIANLLSRKGYDDIIIWAHEEEVVKAINSTGRNPLYMSSIEFKRSVRATAYIEDVVSSKDFLISVLPSFAVRRVWTEASKFLDNNSIIINCTKGIEFETGKVMHEVLRDVLPEFSIKNITVLSGPSFAKEVALGLTTLVTIAGDDDEVTKKVQSLLHDKSFLTFISKDMIGTEVGGALKNVIAVACGICDGMELGENARAAIITRGLYEMIKVGQKMGANPLTFVGLGGVGDLVLTCTGGQSRNHRLGFEVGNGGNPKEIIKKNNMVAEGYASSKGVYELCKRLDISTPICTTVYMILHKGLLPKDALEILTSMSPGEELRSIKT